MTGVSGEDFYEDGFSEWFGHRKVTNRHDAICLTSDLPQVCLGTFVFQSQPAVCRGIFSDV